MSPGCILRGAEDKAGRWEAIRDGCIQAEREREKSPRAQ